MTDKELEDIEYLAECEILNVYDPISISIYKDLLSAFRDQRAEVQRLKNVLMKLNIDFIQDPDPKFDEFVAENLEELL